MSFERTPDGLSIGQYYGLKSGTMKEPTSAIAAYIIDLLETKLPHIEDRIGNTNISYSWFHSAEPQVVISSPAVGISVAPKEHQTLGQYISTSYGSMVPGTLMRGEIVVFIVADSPRMREDISSRIFRVLNKEIHNNISKLPIIYLERHGFGDDRGFSSIERYIMSSLWQNTTEDLYLKIDTYEIGYSENYIDEEDPVDWAVIGNIDAEMESDGILLPPPITNTSFTFKTTFTPKVI